MRNNLKFKGNSVDKNNHLWDEYEDEYGNSSIREHKLVDSSKWHECNCDGNWVFVGNEGDIQCSNCGRGTRIIWGNQFLIDGYIKTGVINTKDQ